MNILNKKARLRILQCLLEGNSIRSTARIAGVSKGAVLKLLSNAGSVCSDYHEDNVKDVNCEHIQIDELWSFIYSKKSTETKKRQTSGDAWTWTAICSESKIVPCWFTGTRTAESANVFIKKLSRVVTGKFQVTTDGFRAYESAMWDHMKDKDYAMLTKQYVKKGKEKELIIRKDRIQGEPDLSKVSTSFVERQNLNIRMSVRRFTRKTNAFSKKQENHSHALSLYFFYYNFIRKHRSIKTAPAVACGLKESPLSLDFILDLIDENIHGIDSRIPKIHPKAC